MRRRTFLIGLATATLGVADPLRAEDPAQAVIDRLRSEGFGDITSKRTFIGRIRVTASKRGQSREVVIDPRTGEILRDLTRRTAAAEADGGTAATDGSGGSGSGSGGSDDGGSDDGGSDDGGSGSGSGGGSGGGSDDGGSDDGGSDHGGSDHDGGDSGGDDGGSDGGGNDD